MTETEDASNSAGGTPRSDVNPTLGVDTDQAPEAPETIRTLTETSPFKPKKPKFGGLSQVGPDSYAAWTGGKPKADWTELEDPNPADIQPNQFRATSVSTQAKSQAYRRRGLENLFSKEHDVLLFQNDVMNHLEDYGMDTITYIQDPVDGKTLISIVDHYGKFTRETGSEKGDDSCIKPDRNDFVSYEEGKFPVEGLGKEVAAKGRGRVKWVVQGVNGVFRAIYVPCFHIPNSQQRILSTQVLFETYKGSECLLDSKGFVWNCGRRAPGVMIPTKDGLHLTWCYTMDDSAMNWVSDRAHLSYERREQHNQEPNTYTTISSNLMLRVNKAGEKPEWSDKAEELEVALPISSMFWLKLGNKSIRSL